jgi:YD repeat-containing protein
MSMRNNFRLCLVCCAVLLTWQASGGIMRADTLSYAYDSAGRLARVDQDNGISIVYAYDANGNLLSRTVQGPNTVVSPKAEAGREKSKAGEKKLPKQKDE